MGTITLATGNRKKPPKQRATAKPILQLKVRGPGIRPGRIPVPELIRICKEAQNAINKQAEAMEGLKTKHPGPISGSIQNECTLELVAIKRGSTTLQFAAAKPQLPLFPDANNRANEAVSELASTLKSLGNGNKRKDIAPGVLHSLYNLGSVIGPKVVSGLEWIVPRNNGTKKMSAGITQSVQAKLAERISAPRKAMMPIEGVLDMADFRPSQNKCIIAPALGAEVVCTFDADKANVVYALLRKTVRVYGEAQIEPYSEKPISLAIKEIQEVPSLHFGKNIFKANFSIEDLSAAQGVKPIKTASELATNLDDTEDDLDAMLEEIYDSRH
ncbi:MAG TPA: hypothetical protein VM120_17590 [Bryobacteraceae bacterium]|nr:hypothetical protein [Bryobacteraceae bacterium]